MKIDSLKLQVEFDFDNLICTVTDMERNISDGYRHYNAFDDYSSRIEQITHFNTFIGKCVGAFLDDNFYDVIGDEEDDCVDEEDCDDYWDNYDWCYECTGYGDDYSYDEDGELVSNCDDCPHNPNRHDDWDD